MARKVAFTVVGTNSDKKTGTIEYYDGETTINEVLTQSGYQIQRNEVAMVDGEIVDLDDLWEPGAVILITKNDDNG